MTTPRPAQVETAIIRDDYDLVLLDLRMPGMDGAVSIQRFRDRAPSTPIVVVSASDQSEDAAAALAAGALGYLTKTASPDVMLAYLRRILETGETVVDGVSGTDAAAALGLTPRQIEILRLLANGRSNREIAEALSITEGTVKIHVSTIIRSLGVRNRTEAAACYSNFRS